jgi:glutaredoxin
LRVTLYSKDDCGLCREAEAMLRRLQKRSSFELEIVDIEDDKSLFDEYWIRIPVIAMDGEEVAAAPLDERRLQSLFLR